MRIFNLLLASLLFVTSTANASFYIPDGGVTRSKLAVGAVAKVNYVSYSSINSLGATDDVVSLSGASFTFTLTTAVGVKGRKITINHDGLSLSQVYTLATTSGQTIGGVASGAYVLATNGESLTLVSDNANWKILEHRTDNGWQTTGTGGVLINYWTCTVTSASATIAAVYANNSQSFTVTKTIASLTTLILNSTGSPTSSGTFTKSSGTGDATITFSSCTGAPDTMSATTIRPTFYGAPVTNSYQWRRLSNVMEVWIQFYQDTAGPAVGSGDYLYPMPTGALVDTAIAPLFTGGTPQSITSQDPAIQKYFMPIWGRGTRSGVQATYTSWAPYTTSSFRAYASDSNTDGNYANGSSRMSANVIHGWNARLLIPISNWQP